MENTILIKEDNFENARKEIKKNKDKKIIFSSDNDELNRKILEKEKIDVLLLNQSKRKDFQKQRNSGFNHVLAKIAKKNNIAIGINLDEIIDAPELRNSGLRRSSCTSLVYAERHKNKAEILARIKQNIKLCNKNKLKMKFISIKEKRNFYDLKALGLVLGMPTWMVKNL